MSKVFTAQDLKIEIYALKKEQRILQELIAAIKQKS